jgi:hypothetical protein
MVNRGMKYKIFIYTTHMTVYATNCDWLSYKLKYIFGPTHLHIIGLTHLHIINSNEIYSYQKPKIHLYSCSSTF